MNEQFHARLYKRIKDALSEWSQREYVPEKDLYAFLHMLQGTSGTLGLPEISKLAAEKLQDLDEHGERQWTTAEWRERMNPFQEIADMGERSLHAADGVAAAADVQRAPSTAGNFILLIDDDHDFIAWMKEILEQTGYTVSAALTAQKGLELYYQLRPDWIAVNPHLPDPDGLDLFTQMIHKARKENTPVAIVGNGHSKEDHLLTYTIGAQDYMPKPVDPDVLKAYLVNRLSYKKEIDTAIIMDELTGAYNRKHFNTMLQFFLSEYQREGQPFCLVMMDLDHFKKVNDIHGHLKGDEVLQTFAKIAGQSKRRTDTLFRYGGEEFALILPRTAGDPAGEVIGRIRTALARHSFESEQGGFQVTFSSGLVECSPQISDTEDMVRKADQALYHAKRSGRDQSMVYQTDLQIMRQPAKLHVIIVDDVYIIREVLATHFRDWAPESNDTVIVSEFADGVSFLQSNWYRPGARHVILLDVIMPGMDGLEVLRQIRETWPSRNVLVAMLTARGGEADVLNAIEHGADDYVVKPFQAEEVAARIQRLIKRRFH